MARVIAISAQAQMGKDTVADRLCLKLNERNPDSSWKRAAFASNVKKVFCDTFGVDMAFVEEWKVKDEIPPGFEMTVRQALQFIGDGFRKIRPTIWLDLTFRDTTAKVISDGRYVNEFSRVHEEEGLNILIGRPDKLNNDPNGSEAQIKPFVEWALNNLPPEKKFINLRGWDVPHAHLHKSPFPQGFEKFRIFIRNDGTKDDLYQLVDEQLVPFVESYSFGDSCPISTNNSDSNFINTSPTSLMC
jgi:hypothetical protein